MRDCSGELHSILDIPESERGEVHFTISGGKFLSPADYVIRVFGGVNACARALGRKSSTVSKWRTNRKTPVYKGLIPAPVQLDILMVARRMGLDITPEDLVCGRRVK